MIAHSRNQGRRAIRTTLAVGAVSLGLLALTACGTKPSPNAHFTLGTTSTSPETAEGCHGHGAALEADQARECLEGVQEMPVFRTYRDDTLRVGVDPVVAENGWLLMVSGEPLALEPSSQTYRSLDVADLYGPGVEEAQLSLLQVSEEYDLDELLEAYEAGGRMGFDELFFTQLEGVWNVHLELKH